ncbi:hypothetical protein EGW08_023849 [Elysia chlorotica]|uniref:Uncharacterized protein n=1 Tax=Elysia chlorotica TaxID=188477 RepID=A0A3S0ZIN7_ELYCH|nr:hypothetical protein EGW08_023849 [Elysia chlorotica]
MRLCLRGCFLGGIQPSRVQAVPVEPRAIPRVLLSDYDCARHDDDDDDIDDDEDKFRGRHSRDDQFACPELEPEPGGWSRHEERQRWRRRRLLGARRRARRRLHGRAGRGLCRGACLLATQAQPGRKPEEAHAPLRAAPPRQQHVQQRGPSGGARRAESFPRGARRRYGHVPGARQRLLGPGRGRAVPGGAVRDPGRRDARRPQQNRGRLRGTQRGTLESRG